MIATVNKTQTIRSSKWLEARTWLEINNNNWLVKARNHTIDEYHRHYKACSELQQDQHNHSGYARQSIRGGGFPLLTNKYVSGTYEQAVYENFLSSAAVCTYSRNWLQVEFWEAYCELQCPTRRYILYPRYIYIYGPTIFSWWNYLLLV